MTLLGHTVVLGLAGFFLFYALNNAPFLRPFHALLSRIHHQLPRCPWCATPYLVFPLAILLVGLTSPPTTFLPVLTTFLLTFGASAVAGVLGSLIPTDDGEPT